MGHLTNMSKEIILSPSDLKRLHSYLNNTIDYHLILDLLPPLALAYFTGRLQVNLSFVQATILLCLGLQFRSVSDMEKSIDITTSQVLTLINKTIRKLISQLHMDKKISF